MTSEKLDIPPYIYKRSSVNGFDFYYYLHVKGGSGNWRGKAENHLNGGEYDYCLFYASPDEMEGIDCCERVWCKQRGIIYGLGKSIEDAYLNWKNKNDKPKENE